MNAQTLRKLTLPQGMAYGWWRFEEDLLHDLAFEIEIAGDVAKTPGRYLQLYQGRIGGAGMYFGFQTDVYRPREGGQGRGLLFSRWKTRNPDDAQAAPGGWVENSGHEGDFVGVRVAFDWVPGRYNCVLAPVGSDDVGAWYEFRVRRPPGGPTISAGTLRFPLEGGASPLIHSGGGTWTEVYSGAGKFEDVPDTHLIVHRLSANNGMERPTHVSTDYNKKFPHADAYVSNAAAGSGALHLRSGGGLRREHDKARYNLK